MFPPPALPEVYPVAVVYIVKAEQSHVVFIARSEEIKIVQKLKLN